MKVRDRRDEAGSLDPVDRVRAALGGIIPAAVAVPIVMSVWAPQRIVLLWLALYLLFSAVGLTVAVRRPSPQAELIWSRSVAVLFAFIPISAAVWPSEGQEAFWMAALVAVIYIAFELSYLPFTNSGDWRAAILIVALSITGTGLVTINPIVALIFLPITYAMLDTTDRIRRLRIELATRLTDVELLAESDPLTGLLNRRGVDALLRSHGDQPVSVLLVDLDDFKLINDTRGYAVGDQVLVEIARELQCRMPSPWRIGRQGGDEFIAIAPGRFGAPPDVASPVRCAVNSHGHSDELEVRFSGGFAIGSASAPERLVSQAGYALRDAKRSDTPLATFDADLRERFDRSLEIASVDVLDPSTGSFIPYGQPIFGESGAVGCELLVRWKSIDGTILEPRQFLSMAAENGMMPLVNNLMLRQGVAFAARFNGRRDAPFVSVNISATHLGLPSLASQVSRLLTEYGVSPERLMLEITESDRLDHRGRWELTARQLRSFGVKLALDDFGSGYSGIERLQHLPITHLKFDRSLIQRADGPTGEIIAGVTRFGLRSNVGIIAEGIETVEELNRVRDLGINVFQGYLFARPSTLEVLEQSLLADTLPPAPSPNGRGTTPLARVDARTTTGP